MKIYLDILIITNAVITLAYISCISRVLHQRLSPQREAAACAVGGVGSLTAVIESTGAAAALGITIAKLAVISGVILTAFAPRSLSAYIKRLFLYGLCELVFGGLCLMLVRLTRREIIFVRNYTVYFNVSLFQIAVCCLCVYLLISAYEFLARRRGAAAKKYRATYSLGRYEISLPAVADSGNKLCDSFTGTPVVIFCSDEMYSHYRLDRPEMNAFYGFRPIPYSTINGEGIIYITSKGEVRISSDEGCKSVVCCVGILPNGKRRCCAIFDPALLND